MPGYPMNVVLSEKQSLVHKRHLMLLQCVYCTRLEHLNVIVIVVTDIHWTIFIYTYSTRPVELSWFTALCPRLCEKTTICGEECNTIVAPISSVHNIRVNGKTDAVSYFTYPFALLPKLS